MKKLRLILLLLVLLMSTFAGWHAWRLFRPALNTNQETELRIRSGWDADRLTGEFWKKAGLKDTEAFKWWLKRLGYQKIWPCRIKIPAGSSIYDIVEILKSNRNQTVNVTILGSMKAEKLAALLEGKLEISAEGFLNEIKGGQLLISMGFNDTNWMALMIPDTYNFSVATDLKGFLERMKTEYGRFWNEERLALAKRQGLSPLQAAAVASIVTKESNKTDEYENIAGVYINRLRKGMPLQADPTICFARGYDGRVLKKDLEIESPYNTYKYKGLPPGPICIPNRSSVEAVLNYSGHTFLYFVADPSLNGYHHFSKTAVEHEIWAARFRLAAWKKKKK